MLVKQCAPVLKCQEERKSSVDLAVFQFSAAMPKCHAALMCSQSHWKLSLFCVRMNVAKLGGCLVICPQLKKISKVKSPVVFNFWELANKDKNIANQSSIHLEGRSL